MRKVFGNENYEKVHSIGDIMSVGECVFLTSLVDGDFLILCRLPDQRLIDVLK